MLELAAYIITDDDDALLCTFLSLDRCWPSISSSEYAVEISQSCYFDREDLGVILQ